MSIPFDDMLSLPVILAWLRKNAKKIIAGGIVFALLAVPVLLFKSKTYESVATLLVSPPAFKELAKPPTARDDDEPTGIAKMMPRTMPVEAYKALATSPPLLYEVIQKVPLEDIGVKGLQERLEVELVQMGSRTSQGVNYTQALIFRATANDPQLAADIAQTWAEVFKEQIDELAAKGVGETFVLLDKLHERMENQLEEADLALAEHKKKWNLDLLKAQLESKQTQLTEFEKDLKQAEVDLSSTEMQLAALQEELAKEEKKDVFFRAPSDDAYWIVKAQTDGEKKLEPDQGLRTEVSNPSYVNTRMNVIAAREKVEGLKAKKTALAAKMDELDGEIDQLSGLITEKSVEREQLTREADSLTSSYKLVRAEYEKGRIADETRGSDIVIAGKAVAPRSESGLPSPVLILLAGVAGMILVGGFLGLKALADLAPDPDLLLKSNVVAPKTDSKEKLDESA